MPVDKPCPLYPPPSCNKCPTPTRWESVTDKKNPQYKDWFVACRGPSGTDKTHFYRWRSQRTPPMASQPAFMSQPVTFAPTHYYAPPPPVIQPLFQSQTPKLRCIAGNCSSSRVNKICMRCAPHCKARGGCSARAHDLSRQSSASQQPFASQPAFIPSVQPSEYHPMATPSLPSAQPQVLSFTEPSSFPSLSPEPHSPVLQENLPLPNPHLKTQIRPIFTVQKQLEISLQEEARREAAAKRVGQLRAKANVDVCVWHENDIDPEEMAIQDGFIFPHFQLTPEILEDLNLDMEQRVALYRISTMTTVTRCARFEERLSALLDSSSSSRNMWKSLGKQRSAINAQRIERLVQEAPPKAGSSRQQPVAPSSSKRPAITPNTSPSDKPSSQKRSKKQRSPAASRSVLASIQDSQPLPDHYTASPSPSCSLDIIGSQSTSSKPTSVISLSSTSPSPPPKIKREACSTPISLGSSSSSSSTTSSDLPSPNTASDPKNLVWPSDLLAVDIVKFFGKTRKPVAGVKVATRFVETFNVLWKKSTFYDNRNRWDSVTQEARDAVLKAGRGPGGLWSHFSGSTPAPKAEAKAAAKRIRHRRKKAQSASIESMRTGEMDPTVECQFCTKQGFSYESLATSKGYIKCSLCLRGHRHYTGRLHPADDPFHFLFLDETSYLQVKTANSQYTAYLAGVDTLLEEMEAREEKYDQENITLDQELAESSADTTDKSRCKKS
ncbi:hypothetical protein C8J56DRAFT_1062079 [Mycena floridula]|nr:hypothetical protein C8J56DRAFT_1062079 [Mycena floridula]